MNRYKSRGKLTAIGQEGDGDWVFGYYCKILATHFIIPDCADYDHMDEDVFEVQGLCEVDGDTVGQYIGERDKNKTEICVGDKIDHEGKSYEVIYGHGAYYKMRSLWEECIAWQRESLDFCETDESELEITGTIHDKDSNIK